MVEDIDCDKYVLVAGHLVGPVPSESVLQAVGSDLQIA
jgi:hypothetical protein